MRKAISGLVFLLAFAAPGFAAQPLGPEAARPAGGRQAADQAPALPDRFQTLFGRRYLPGIDVVAEVEIAKVARMGLAVDVVTARPLTVFADHLAAAERKEQGLVFFANRGAYTAGDRALVLMARFGSGRHYEPRLSLSATDDEYAVKVKLIGAYVRVELIRDERERVLALKKLLMEQLADPSSWARRNTLYELEGLVRSEPHVFGKEDAGVIDALSWKDASDADRKKLVEIKSLILESQGTKEPE